MRDRRLLVSAPVLVFAVCLACYYLTLAPTITWQHDGVDSGDLVTAAYTLGIPHPPGYPLFTILARLFISLPLGGVAYRVNLMSAVFAAGAASIACCTALLLRPPRLGTVSVIGIATGSALLLGFSRTFWSQAIIAEVYALNAFLVAVSIFLVTLYRRTGSGRLLWMLGLTLGLSLGNHLSAVLFLPGVLILIFRRSRPRAATCLGAAAFFLVGLGTYAYLPLRSAYHPPVDWGAPHTWLGFWWTVSARIYREYAFGLPLAHLPSRVASWLSLLKDQFTWIGLAIGLVGLWNLWENDRDYLGFSLASFGAVVVYSIAYNTTDSYVYLIPSYLVFVLWIALGATYLLQQMIIPWGKQRWDRASSRSHLTSVAGVFLLLLPVPLLLTNYAALDLSSDQEALAYGTQVLSETPSDALIIADTDAHIFALWYARYVESSEPAPAVVAKGLYQYSWYKDILRWHHPQIILPAVSADHYAELHALIEANLPRRPVYLTDLDDQIVARYSHSQVGRLYRLWVKG